MNRRKQILSCAGALLFVLVLLSGIYAAVRPGDTLRIGCQEFTGNFSPFFAGYNATLMRTLYNVQVYFVKRFPFIIILCTD